MNIKSYLAAGFLSIVVIGLYVINYISEPNLVDATQLYKVYLGGNEIGLIESDDELYNLINEEQTEIKNDFNVDSVYPPNDLDIVKIKTYSDNISSVTDIYKEIEKSDDFTIKGYTATIRSEGTDDVVINVLDEKVFDDAIYKFVTAFVDEELYQDYLDGTQDEIADEGEYIDVMYFEENVAIKENYISVNDKIYTDATELTQYLLFGDDANIDSYTVQKGDTIASISNDNSLNTKEFLIANPSYRDSDTLLAIGATVNITLVDPILNFSYEVTKVEEVEVDFVNTNEVDDTKDYDYSEITSPGITGIEVNTTEFKVTNGLPSKQVIIVATEVIRDVTNQVTVVGPTYVPSYTGSSTMRDYVYTGLEFTLPTVPGVILTSPFNEWRDGYAHKGTDYSNGISGSPIFAIADGVVTQAGWGSGGQGNYVIISHGNGYYSNYMHMVSGSLLVSAGDTVKMGQQIGGMGNTGWSQGIHLHIEFTFGEPYTGANVIYYNAHSIIYGG